MPAYTSIDFEFDKPVGNDFVRRFYTAFLNDDIRFSRALAWGSEPDQTLEDIIAWNQHKLDMNFIPGMDTHIRHYSRQICLTVPPFSECRLIISNYENWLKVWCIIPETEISAANCKVIEDAALRTWSEFDVKIVESYGELEGAVGAAKVAKGVQPAARLFAIVRPEISQHASKLYFLPQEIEDGVILRPNPQHDGSIYLSELRRLLQIAFQQLDGKFLDEKQKRKVESGSPYEAYEWLSHLVKGHRVSLSEKDRLQLECLDYYH